jgi:hypothetical protein
MGRDRRTSRDTGTDGLFVMTGSVLHLMGVQIASEKRRNPWTTAGSGYRIRRVLRLRRRQIMGHTRARLQLPGGFVRVRQ